MPTLTTVLRDAKSLPKQQRVELIEKLTKTLVPESDGKNAREDMSWVEELKRGTLKTVSYEEGLTRMASFKKSLQPRH